MKGNPEIRAAYPHAGKEVDMNVDMQSILGCAFPGESRNTASLPKAQMADEVTAARALFDKVDVASFPSKIDNVVSGSYEKNVTYEENWSAFMADTKIAYEGQDGSKVFIDFSYKTITRKIRYEVTQSIEGVGAEHNPERLGHPMGTYFGPNATANRILDFARGLVHKFMAMEGDDREKLAAYINKLLKAMEEGFGGLHKVTRGIPHPVTGMVRETYDRVMNGMVALQNALMGGKEVGVAKLIYEEEVTYTSTSMEIYVVA
jgi:hypothetical protein